MDQATDSPEFLTVPELATLLRIKERKVYDLAASGAVPCSRVTGKLLFPRDAVRAWIAGGAEAVPAERPAVFLGSHDPLLDWALRQSRAGLATYFDGSGDGLRRFAAGEGVATGLHVRGARDWNVEAVADAGIAGAVLLAFATRRRGLVLRPGSEVRGIGDLVGRRLAPRQAGSGSAVLFERLCAEAGIDPADIEMSEVAHSEADAVLDVRQGRAEATFGLETLAQPYGLPFVPLVSERFDILVDRKAWFDPPLQALRAFLRGQSFRRHAAGVAGYDLTELGTVRWNG